MLSNAANTSSDKADNETFLLVAVVGFLATLLAFIIYFIVTFRNPCGKYVRAPCRSKPVEPEETSYGDFYN